MDIPKPQQFIARFEDKLIHNDKYVQYAFELKEPHRMPFVAGQYVSMQVNDKGERRSYSLCSTPDIDHGFEILVDISPQGTGSRFLESLAFGAEVKVLGPMGRFITEQNEAEKALVYVATGSGIAPMRSMIVDQLRNKQDKRPIVLNWGMRYVKELFWLQDFQDLQEAFDNFTFHPVISRPETERWTLCSGHVTDCLKAHGLPDSAGYYLCGNEHMITDVSEYLKQQGVAQEQVHYEKFY